MATEPFTEPEPQAVSPKPAEKPIPPRRSLPPLGPPQPLIRTPGWSLFGRGDEAGKDQVKLKKADSDRNTAST
jgi:hypothetical protein